MKKNAIVSPYAPDGVEELQDTNATAVSDDVFFSGFAAVLAGFFGIGFTIFANFIWIVLIGFLLCSVSMGIAAFPLRKNIQRQRLHGRLGEYVITPADIHTGYSGISRPIFDAWNEFRTAKDILPEAQRDFVGVDKTQFQRECWEALSRCKELSSLTELSVSQRGSELAQEAREELAKKAEIIQGIALQTTDSAVVVTVSEQFNGDSSNLKALAQAADARSRTIRALGTGEEEI